MSKHSMERTLTGLKRKGTLKEWREKQGHRLVHIYSKEWHAYWRAEACGYTTDAAEAGVYTLDKAISYSGHCGPEKKIVYRFIKESQA